MSSPAKILQVARREFAATVLTKAFFFGLVLMPVMVLITLVGFSKLSFEKPPKIEGEVAVVDPTGEVIAALREYLAPEAIAKRREEFRKMVEEHTPQLPLGGSSTGAAREKALEALLGEVPKLHVMRVAPEADLEREKEALYRDGNGPGKRLALVVVHPDAVNPDRKTGFGAYDLFIRKKLDDRIVDEIRGGVRNAIVEARIVHAGLDRNFIESLTKLGRIEAVTVTPEGEAATNEVLNALLPAAFLALLFMSVMTGGQSLMTSTVEEKSSRVVEVILSAVSPMELMTGKILGQMLVGFLILAVYAGMGVAALVVFALSGVLDPMLLLYLVIFYVIAYSMIASLLAAVGSAVNEMREAQSLMGPIMLILVIPWLLWLPISRDPNSTFAVVTSFLPPLNPFVMMLRLTSTSPPPWWEVWLSILVGLAGVYGALWAAAKVFRVGLLMFGKPPNFRTLLRWIHMA